MISRSAAIVYTTHYKDGTVLCFELFELDGLAVRNIEKLRSNGER